MSSIDLNIKDRGISGQAWSSEYGKLTAGDLDEVIEMKSNNSSALNSLPTPFARFFVFKEAYRRVLEELKDPHNEAGRAYQRLVSDSLDVFEILFNLNYHRNHWRGQDVIIREWDANEDLNRLHDKSSKLYNSLMDYFSKDIGLDKLLFVVFRENGREYLLGTSSPMTGFITPPDLDKLDYITPDKVEAHKFAGKRYEGMRIARKTEGGRSRGYYFDDIVLFPERSQEFKNYMFKLVDDPDLNDSFSVLRAYIKKVKDTDKTIRDDYQLRLKSITTDNSEPVVINGMEVFSSDALDIRKIFTDCLIKLPYRISEDNFYVAKVENKEDRNHDYLLPITAEALEIIDTDNIQCSIKEKGVSASRIDVKLICGGKEYVHTYEDSTNPVQGNGRVIKFDDPFRVNIELGIFPNIKSKDSAYNNYYKIMLVTRDGDTSDRFDVSKAECVFYYKEDNGCSPIEVATSESFKNGVYPSVVRSIQDEKYDKCGTKFYEIFDTEFCAIALHLNIEGKEYEGVLIPKFKEEVSSTKSFTYAVDFGTSNTYISKREDNTKLDPVQLQMNSTMMSMLHAIKPSRQINEVDLWETMPFVEALDYFNSEFVPPFIDGERYKFPIRTAMVKTKNVMPMQHLFDTHNIAFSYGKKRISESHEIETDLKWVDGKFSQARMFIRELLMIIKADAMQSDADLKNLSLIWFYPLSFKDKDKYENVWQEGAKQILGISDKQVKCYTESEAPYFYFDTKDMFNNIHSVVNIDIGGGSTDMVYFEEGKPCIANSVHFGCDVLWGNGHNQVENARDNGIVNHFKGLIRFTDEEISAINNDIITEGGSASTVDIINFWLSNDKFTDLGDEDKFSDLLKRDCKPVFLYHYAAIIYYVARLIESKGLECPRAITFSGNGSRYIDGYLSADKDFLAEMTMIVLQKVFGDDVKPVQLILPDCRKESTCYGGLYRAEGLRSPEAVLFNGANSNSYKKVSDLSKAYNDGTLKNGILSNLDELNDCFMRMLEKLVGAENVNNISLSEVRKKILDGMEDSLDKNFRKKILDRYADDAEYRDTLFFIPVIDKIKDLTQIEDYLNK